MICRADDRLDPVIQLAPPLTIPEADVDQVVAVIADDLITAGYLEVHHTDPVEIELDALTRMIERVRSI